MNGSLLEFVILLFSQLILVGVSLVLILPRIVERVLIEKFKHRNQILLAEKEHHLSMNRDIFNNAISTSSESGHELRKKSISSVQTLWEEILRVENEFSSLVGIVNITTDVEMNDLVRGKGPSKARAAIERYSEINSVLEMIYQDTKSSVTRERIFVSEKLWKIFNSLVTIHGRLGILVSYGVRDQKDVNWKNDTLMIQVIEGIISSEDWKKIQNMPLSGFNTLAETIRQEFILEARKTMRGADEFNSALGNFREIMAQEEILGQEKRAESKEFKDTK